MHQPNFLPWLGYFYKIHLADIFIFLDDVQYIKRSYINRTAVFSPQSQHHIVSIPTKKHSQGTNINQVMINHEHGTENIHKTLERSYGKCRRYATLLELNSKIKNVRDYEKISELNIDLNKYIINELFPGKEILVASSFNIKSQGEQRIIDLMKAIGGNEYVSGTGAKAYQKSENFKENNLELTYVDYPDINYAESRKLSDGFSIYDFIAYEGMENPFL